MHEPIVEPGRPPVALPKAFEARLSLMLVRAGDEIAGRGQAALESVGISGREYTALAVIDADQPSSQLELARLMGKAPALCVAVLDDLEAAGLAARVRDPKDRRRSIVSLTEQGQAVLARADAVARELEASLLSGLSDAQREQLLALLGQGVTETTTVYTGP